MPAVPCIGASDMPPVVDLANEKERVIMSTYLDAFNEIDDIKATGVRRPESLCTFVSIYV